MRVFWFPAIALIPEGEREDSRLTFGWRVEAGGGKIHGVLLYGQNIDHIENASIILHPPPARGTGDRRPKWRKQKVAVLFANNSMNVTVLVIVDRLERLTKDSLLASQ